MPGGKFLKEPILRTREYLESLPQKYLKENRVRFHLSTTESTTRSTSNSDVSKIVDDCFEGQVSDKNDTDSSSDIHNSGCLKRKVSDVVNTSYFVAGLHLYLIRHVNFNKIRDLDYIHGTSATHQEEIQFYYQVIADFLIRNNLHSSFCVFMSEVYPLLKDNIRFLGLWTKLRDSDSLNSSKLLLEKSDIENILLSFSIHPTDINASEVFNRYQENKNENILDLLFSICREKYMYFKEKYMYFKTKLKKNQTRDENEKLQSIETIENIEFKITAMNFFYEQMKQNYEILLKEKDIKRKNVGFHHTDKACKKLHQDKEQQTEGYGGYISENTAVPQNTEHSINIKFMKKEQNYLLKKRRKEIKRHYCHCKSVRSTKKFNYISNTLTSTMPKKYNLAKDTEIHYDEVPNEDVIKIANSKKIQEQTRIEDITKENQELRKLNFELLKRLDCLSVKLYETNEKLLRYSSHVNNVDKEVETPENIFNNLEIFKTKDEGIADGKENIELTKNYEIYPEIYSNSIKKLSEIETKEKLFSTSVESKSGNCKVVMPSIRRNRQLSDTQIIVDSKHKLLETCSIENIKCKLEQLKSETLSVTEDYQNLVKKKF